MVVSVGVIIDVLVFLVVVSEEMYVFCGVVCILKVYS